MEHNQNGFTPGASTDERASPLNSAFEPGPPDASGHPTFDSPEAERLYWRAYMDGVRAAGREPGHPHMPTDFSLDLARDGASPALVSSKLIETWPEAVPLPGGGSAQTGYGGSALPIGAGARAVRHDGWTGERQRIFLDALAQTGVVADACRAAGMGRDGAYDLRKRAEGRAFAIAWDAAVLAARRNIADDVMSRARHGVIDRVYRNGELVAERHRYDNRLTMAVLTRLDRLAEGLGEGAATARTVAGEWDQFLDIVEAGGEAAESFIRARTEPPSPAPAKRSAQPVAAASAEARDMAAAATRLARLAAYGRFQAGLPCEIRTDDLDPEGMEEWTEEQWARADYSGLLDRLGPDGWPDIAYEEGETGEDGMCRVRRVYLERHPAPPPVPDSEDDFEGCHVWGDEEDGFITNFPPPDGFDGWEDGEPGSADYQREVTEEELARCSYSGKDDVDPFRIERLAAQEAARRRYFYLDWRSEEDESAGEEAEEEAALPAASASGSGD